MAKAVVTLKIMPDSPEANLQQIEDRASELIDSFVGEPGEKRIQVEPLAFGLQAIKISFVMDEEKGSTEPLEATILEIDAVQSVDVIDVRRAVG